VEVSEILNDTQRRGLIEKSERPWLSPVVLIRKKFGGMRFCADYRKVNDVSRKG
jgi:hypothetical protein